MFLSSVFLRVSCRHPSMLFLRPTAAKTMRIGRPRRAGGGKDHDRPLGGEEDDERDDELAPFEPPAEQDPRAEDEPRVDRREGRDRLAERHGLKDNRGAQQQHSAGPQVGQEPVQVRPLLRRVSERRPAVPLERLGRIGLGLPLPRGLLGGWLPRRGLCRRLLLLHTAHFTTATEMWSMRAMRRGAMAVLVVHVRSAVPRPRRWTPPRSRRSGRRSGSCANLR